MQASIDGARSTKTRSSSPQVEVKISEFQEDWVLLGTPDKSRNQLTKPSQEKALSLTFFPQNNNKIEVK